MITPQLARALRLAGLRWRPTSGDLFVIDRDGFEGDVFTVSDMTIEAHEYDTGTVLGFNGTTEWALDSVALDDALWMPAEHQLRALLGATFRSLRRAGAEARDAGGGDFAGGSDSVGGVDSAGGTDSAGGADSVGGVDDDGLLSGEAYEVETVLGGQTRVFVATDAADAYAGALLDLIGASSDGVEPGPGSGSGSPADPGLGLGLA